MSQLAIPPSQIPSVALAAADELVSAGYVAGPDRDAVASTISPYLGIGAAPVEHGRCGPRASGSRRRAPASGTR